MNRITIRILAAVLILNLTLGLTAQSQLIPEPSDDLIGTPDPGSDVPLDGGLSLLLAAGAAYGMRRIRRGSKWEDRTKP